METLFAEKFSRPTRCENRSSVRPNMQYGEVYTQTGDGSIPCLKAFRSASDFFSEKWPADGDPAEWEGVKIEHGKISSAELLSQLAV